MIGRVVIKLAGKEAGRLGVIVDQVNNSFVIVDGNFKRRKAKDYWTNVQNALTEARQIMDAHQFERLPSGNTLTELGHSTLAKKITVYVCRRQSEPPLNMGRMW